MKKVLIVGGSGYLGQFLVESLSRHFELAFTYHRQESSRPCQEAETEKSVEAYQVDLSTGSGFESISTDFGEPNVVINCAAISQPRICEEKGELARSVNIPTKLVEWLSEHFHDRPLLVHMSTDHVYEGSKAFNREEEEEEEEGVGAREEEKAGGKEDAPRPVNAYGKSKKDSEEYIKKHYSNHIIFRSSIIYGKNKDVSRTLFLQWMSTALAGDAPVGFFTNEFRSPIYVMDIVKLMESISNQTEGGELRLKNWAKQTMKTFNLGGPDRLSRFDMAKALCIHCGYELLNVMPVDRPEGVKAPLDASMNISRLQETFEFQPTRYAQALKEIFLKEGSSN